MAVPTPHPPTSCRTIRRLAAALEPPARGPLARTLRRPGPWLGAIALCLVLLAVAELHLRGTGSVALEAAVSVALALWVAWTGRRLRGRDQVMAAVRRGRDALGEGFLVSDPATLVILHANAAAGTVFNRAPEDLVGRDARDLLLPGDRDLLMERTRLRAAGHRVPGRVTLELSHPGADRRFAEWATTPLTVDGRELLLTLARDVTAAELGKRRLAEEHAFLEAVLDGAAGPIVALAPDARLLRVNAAAARLAGMERAAMVGRTPVELGLMSAEQAAEVGAALLAGHDPFRHAIAWRGRDGRERTVTWTATAIRDEAGAIRSVVSVGLDMTEQRAAEDRARRAHAALDLRSHELERSNRDLTGFAELAATDLRGSVRAIAGYTDLLEAHAAPALDARARSYLAATRETTGGMDALLDGVAAYGRLGRGEALAADVDCERTLDGVLAGLAAEIEARGAQVTRDRLPVVPGDADELASLLAQLVGNALRHGAPEGDAPRVHVGAQRRGLGWQLTVADRGPGVPEGERQRIFQMFRRAHPRGAGGAGVGLALCQRIVERHGGAIWVDEAAGGGSAFHVTLPDREAR